MTYSLNIDTLPGHFKVAVTVFAVHYAYQAASGSFQSSQSGVDVFQEIFSADAEQAPGGDGYKVRALVDELGDSGGVGRIVAAHSGEFAPARIRGMTSFIHYSADFGRTGVAQALAQVRGRHVENVGPGYLEDVVEVADCFDVFNHGDN